MPLRRSTLADFLTCPRCGRRQGDLGAIEHFVAKPRCFRNDCGQHWWVMYLRAGDVEPQLVDAFQDFDHARLLMTSWQLPTTLDAPKFWQLALTRDIIETHQRSTSRQLLTALFAWFIPSVASKRARPIARRETKP